MTDSRNTAVIIFFVVIAALGWSTYKTRSGTESAAGTPSSTQTVAVSSTALQVSFGCADNTHFIAEFPIGKVKIEIDGKVVRTLSQVGTEGYKYEDSSYIYSFAGEEATVTKKSTGGSTSCEQPRDPNNAPVNFGDTAEGGAGFSEAVQQRDIALVVSENIVGAWKSIQDPKFTRVFKLNGVVEDSYDGKVVTSGTWQAFSSAKPVAVSFPLEKGVVYVKMAEANGQDGTLDFKVAKLTPETLELVYMDRGGVNSFTRIKAK